MDRLRAGTLQTVASGASCAADLLAVPVEGGVLSDFFHYATSSSVDTLSYLKFREKSQTFRHCAWSLLFKQRM